jgi:hypothetical protein
VFVAHGVNERDPLVGNLPLSELQPDFHAGIYHAQAASTAAVSLSACNNRI